MLLVCKRQPLAWGRALTRAACGSPHSSRGSQRWKPGRCLHVAAEGLIMCVCAADPSCGRRVHSAAWGHTGLHCPAIWGASHRCPIGTKCPVFVPVVHTHYWCRARCLSMASARELHKSAEAITHFGHHHADECAGAADIQPPAHRPHRSCDCRSAALCAGASITTATIHCLVTTL